MENAACGAKRHVRGSKPTPTIGKQMTPFHELKMDAITGESVDFGTYQDTMCLVVNVASR
jgi:hypothetical protein